MNAKESVPFNSVIVLKPFVENIISDLNNIHKCLPAILALQKRSHEQVYVVITIWDATSFPDAAAGGLHHRY